MRNWRKWAAGALALACCLSTASIPAFAEEEETAAEETAAAGDSTEAAAEEESSRTEAQEEIEMLHIYRNVDFGRCCPDNNETASPSITGRRTMRIPFRTKMW